MYSIKIKKSLGLSVKRLKEQCSAHSGFWGQGDPIFKTSGAEGLQEKSVTS